MGGVAGIAEGDHRADWRALAAVKRGVVRGLCAGIALAAISASAIAQDAPASAASWGAQPTGIVLALPSDWAHAHPAPDADVAPVQVALLDPDGLILETMTFAQAGDGGGAGASAAQLAPASFDGASALASLVSNALGSEDEGRIALAQAPGAPPASWRAPGETAQPDLAEAPPPPALQDLTQPPVQAPVEAPALPPAATPATTPAAAPAAGPPAPPAQPYFETRIDPTETRAAGVPQAPIIAAPLAPVASAAVRDGAGAGSGAGAVAGRDSYALGPLDRIKLIVFQEPDLSGEFAVQSTGRVALPLLGEMQAQGLSVREFEQAIVAELRARQFLNDPKVAVEVLSARPFYILGEVQKPGEYPYLAGLSALNAIATAGGFTPLADQTSVMIKRVGEPDWKPYPLEGALTLGPGDTLRVEKGAFYILGEVQKAGEYPFTPGMSVLRAVATAQGYTARAERGRVMITRRGETTQRELPMRPDVPIQPGDTIIIPERWF